ncbi:uncharacterized protein LOC130429900 [Triplophysa dalaica]|uniref:uncharacterized protein LOC130429900 n=1 Tax=Triplophysa dalaica TaxID=1582913 RepID=UPI0024DF5E8C|nr:uncharacterized protein LOC130429900 [Triplophysa dalaica]
MTLYRVTLLCVIDLFLLVVNGDPDEVKSVSVMEGDSVTLHTDLTHLQTDDRILWMFGPQETLIADIFIRNPMNLLFVIKDQIFLDRLRINNQNGSLTITNITITHSGLYKLLINSRATSINMRFNVTVYDHLPVPVISMHSSNCSSSSERSLYCSFLCSAMNVSHVSLSWYKGNSLLSSISVSDLNIRLSLPLEVEYQDTNTYRCVINNPITNHIQHLDINEHCLPCPAAATSDYSQRNCAAIPLITTYRVNGP